MAKGALIRDIRQLQEMVAALNGHRHVQGAKFVADPVTVEQLDELFDRLQEQPPWPTGRIDEDTQPELIRALREAYQEVFGTGEGGEESHDP
jgi:hypothetical protein